MVMYRSPSGSMACATIVGVRIVARLDRLRAGLRGDWRSVGGAVWEMRIDYGPGYRVYCAHAQETLFLLLCGGDKRSQVRDIERAHDHWKDYKSRVG